MSNEHMEFTEVRDLWRMCKKSLEQMAILEERVSKLEQQSLDKDRLIELLSSENERLKEEIADHFGTIEELREINDELNDHIEKLWKRMRSEE